MKKKSYYPSNVYLNGEIVRAEAAKISVFDRGFIFGDGVYEVMACIKGHFFYKQAHMDRLKRSMAAIGLQADVRVLEAAIPGLLQESGLKGKDCLLYIQVTRGMAPRQHSYPVGTRPTVMMYAWPKVLPDQNPNPVPVVLREDFRWSRCDIKMTSLLGNVMANQNAAEQGCYETIFERAGIITEASHSNVFFVKEGVVYTHPADHHILDGITRQVVLELCEKLEIDVHLQGIPAVDIFDMDEAFLTGTSTQITPINSIDGRELHTYQQGPVTQKLQQAFSGVKNSL
ncbi:aminotransferase class IV [Robiginitalea sp. IMCC43444]|uniref:aminotransferase class IV n=1 Tax=Robiginitalea sp. IMCC43444 TaxID=3459121 RepID=UPI004042D10D